MVRFAFSIYGLTEQKLPVLTQLVVCFLESGITRLLMLLMLLMRATVRVDGVACERKWSELFIFIAKCVHRQHATTVFFRFVCVRILNIFFLK